MRTTNCRYCQKEIRYNSVSDVPTFPFCSERCKLIDLGLWLDEKHRIETPILQEGEKTNLQKEFNKSCNNSQLKERGDKGNKD